jgi:hypothetical protein
MDHGHMREFLRRRVAKHMEKRVLVPPRRRLVIAVASRRLRPLLSK